MSKMDKPRCKTKNKRVVINSIRYPCVKCGIECGNGTIECSSCKAWTHKDCTTLDDASFQDWASSNDFFLCEKCAMTRSTDGTLQFNTSASLER